MAPRLLPRPLPLPPHAVTCAVREEGEEESVPDHGGGHHQSCLLWPHSCAEPPLISPIPSSIPERGWDQPCK